MAMGPRSSIEVAVTKMRKRVLIEDAHVSLTKMSADMHGISNSSRHVSIYSISQIRHAEMENTTLLPASKLSGLQ
jgi:hypothetical protein